MLIPHRTRHLAITLVFLIALAAIFPLSVSAQGPVTGSTIASGTTIESDAFLSGTEVIVDGNVNGDVFAVGQGVTINGDVDGSVFILAERATIRGKIAGSVYVAAISLHLDANADLERSLYAAVLSLFTNGQSTVGRDINALAFGAQLAGSVGRNTRAIIGPLEIFRFIVPQIEALNLFSTSWAPRPTRPTALAAPDAGQVVRCLNPLALAASPAAGFLGSGLECLERGPGGEPAQAPPEQSNLAENIGPWSLDRVRDLAVLLLIGVILVLALPRRLDAWSGEVPKRPLLAAALGLVIAVNGYVLAFVFTIAIVALAVGIFSLGLSGLGWLVMMLGLSVTAAAFWIFFLFLYYISQVVVAYWGGAWIVKRLAPNARLHRVVPLVIGLVIVVLLAALPVLGPFISIAIGCVGLGAVALAVRHRWPIARAKSTAPAAVVA
jgi:cytoskeletal protein CcmA (bactofilin family)